MAAGDPINGLITNGLGVDLPACAMIMTATTFTLGPCSAAIVIPPAGYYSGGSVPMAPGEAKNFYKPVDRVNLQPAKDFYVQHKVPVKKRIVTVKLTFGDRTTEKEFMIRENKLVVLVKVMNFVKRVSGGISVKVADLKRVTTRAAVRILRFRKR